MRQKRDGKMDIVPLDSDDLQLRLDATASQF